VAEVRFSGVTAVTATGAKRLFFRTYDGGHMFHLRKKSRAEMTADVRGFYQAAP
jgi:carboxypeptidase C (cathepsin A)